ncbi:MAG: iron-containing alcohol dehydrogenase [Gammaproteobacteria bacterium]|nr:iron-containing alcohol dehydrogenase [Gammaproteobacteria bacterium]
MENFEFFNPVRIVFGEGEVGRIGEEAAQYGKKALIVSYKDHAFFSDLLQTIEGTLTKSGVQNLSFYEVTANPLISQVRDGIELCVAEKIDLVIGVGGGSAMDAAKIIAAGALTSEDPWNMVVNRHDQVTANPPEEALPLIMIPTLPATGSEMNCCGVVTNEETAEKSYVWSPCLYPKVSIVDPSLTCSLPEYQTVCGAADTISHVLEFYLNGFYDADLNNRIQEGVILTVMENIFKVLDDPNNIKARSQLQWASIVALNGWSQPGDAWTPMHQLGHVLSAHYNIAHGASLSIIMPAWMKHLHTRRIDTYCQFANRIFGVDEAAKSPDELALEGIDQFESFLKKIGVPTRLSDVNIPHEDIDKLTAAVVKISFNEEGKLSSRPPVDQNDIRAIFEKASS